MVGAHSPEFGFEQHLDNVRRAVTGLGVAYPVVIDNDFAIWHSFGNRYWPALYLLDGDGIVRFHDFGEEAYDEIERAILRADELSLNQWALGGQWTVDEESAGARRGHRVHRVLLRGPRSQPGTEPGGRRGTRAVHGAPRRPAPGDDRGVDVDDAGGGAVSEPRMHQLVRQRGPVRQRTFEIEFRDSGVRAYVFTFG